MHPPGWLIATTVSAVLACGFALAPPAAGARPVAVVHGAAPTVHLPNAALPLSTCTLLGGTRSCELWAKAGTLTLPAGSSPSSVPIWGYADSAGGPASVPGPMIVANVGETLEITLHNDLSDPTSLAFPGQGLVPDTTGVAPTSADTYTVPLTRPGTFRYEAGLTDLGPRQVAMGLQGVIIVRPAAPSRAYDSAVSAFDDEAVVVVSSIDPAFNNAPGSYSFDRYVPRYWLINGQAFPDTLPIVTQSGRDVLLRYVNGGLLPISMGLLGAHETVVGTEGHAATYPHDLVAETIPPGTTLDAVVAVPGSAAAGTRYQVYEQSGRLDNDGSVSGSLAHGGIVGFGGALTSLLVTSDTPMGPSSGSVTISPAASTGSAPVDVRARVSDEATGNEQVTDVEYFIDSPGANGTGTPMTVEGAPAAVRMANATFTPSLTDGVHKVLIHGRDASGQWGPFASRNFRIDTSGPTATVDLDPRVGNDSGPVTATIVGDDATSGARHVTQAELYVDSPCVSGTAVALSPDGPADVTSTFTGEVPAGHPEGSYAVHARTRDGLGNWGPCADATLVIDQTGPDTNAVAGAPNPASGSQPVVLTATAVDPSGATPPAPIAAAEWFIGTDPGAGSGSSMDAVDGVFDSPTEDVSATLNVAALAAGDHDISVRARDAAGNWGPVSTTTLTISASDVVFADGFESGNLSAWTGVNGGRARIAATTWAALHGSYGLRARLNGNSPSYVKDASPVDEPEAHARFWFDPNGTTTNGLTTTIMSGLTSNGGAIFRVQYRTSAGDQQVRGLVLRSGGRSTTAWQTISNAPHAIEMAWASASSASFSLYVDDTLSQTLTALNTSAWHLQQIRLGPSAGLSAGMQGVLRFDDYLMARNAHIGP